MDVFLFNQFLVSGDAPRVYKDDRLLFSSNEDGLLPLLQYIARHALYHQRVVVLDKIMGNAAALLSIKANCREVYSPLGSQLAVKTLDSYGIKHALTEIVPYIQKIDGQDMCPMEKLSINKEPEEFYQTVKNIIN